MKYKVGDKVRIIKPLYIDNSKLGEIMEIIATSENPGNEEYKLQDGKCCRHFAFVDEIELIEEFSSIKELIKFEEIELNNRYRYGEIEHVQDKYDKHKEICSRLNELYISKNKEYGDSFGKAHKEIGVMSGVSDIYHKVQRLVNITKNKEEELKYESLEDTIIDLANYAVMLLTELELEKCDKE